MRVTKAEKNLKTREKLDIERRKEICTERKTQSGITLIALIVTIIVLLILAEVSIATLTGDNGILTRAQGAKNKTEQATEEELRRLTAIEAASNFENKTITDTSMGNNIEVTIPAGFAVSQVDGENSIEKGLVIIDSDGNEYVWIPVLEKSSTCTWGVDYGGNSVTISKDANGDEYTDLDYTNLTTALKEYTSNYSDTNYTDIWYGTADNLYGYYDSDGNINYYSNGNMSEEEYDELYKKTLRSIYKNGGFYVARYEMGIGVANSKEEAQNLTRTDMIEYVSTETNENNTEPSIDGMSKPISKPNAVQYTFITQSQGQMLAQSLNYTSVYSSLMFGVQRDIVSVFLEHFGKTINGVQFDETYLNTSKSNLWGNYINASFKINRGFYRTMDSNSNFTSSWQDDLEQKDAGNIMAFTTGASEQNKALNIYDWSGNLYEMTLETASFYGGWANPRVSRKGTLTWDDNSCNRSTDQTYRYSRIATSRIFIAIDN